MLVPTETEVAIILNEPEFIRNVRGTFEKCLGILKSKNADYAITSDPFRNLRSAEGVLGVPTERAILVRILDKISRINNLIEKSPDVANESLEDAIEDAIGYLALIKAYREVK
jgi:hypothetical protein